MFSCIIGEYGIERIPYQRAEVVAGSLRGTIPILDVRYGNVWTNINASLLAQIEVVKGQRLSATILHGDHLIYAGEMPFVDSFGDVPVGQPLAYINSLDNIALAINQGDFAATFSIASGSEWQIQLTPLKR